MQLKTRPRPILFGQRSFSS